MGAAAEWADISPFPRCAEDDGRTIATGSVTNLTWNQQQQTMAAAPLFGGRRTWRHYSYETTGYGSLELRGPLAYRVTIVHPGDPETLRRHHRLVRSGRLQTALRARRLDGAHLQVMERDALVALCADEPDSWLVTAQHIARWCASDDEVAGTAGQVLHRLLWNGRHQLGTRPMRAALADLRHATEDLVAERARYRVAVDRWIDTTSAVRDIDAIRFETRVLADARRELVPPDDDGC